MSAGAPQRGAGPVPGRASGLRLPSPTYLLLRGIAGTVRRLPMPLAQRLGTALGSLLFRAIRRYRQVARRNLTAAFGWDAPQVDAVARKVFRNLSKSLVEFLRLPALSPAEVRDLCALEGMEHLRSALGAGRGAIIVTAHYGSWELLAARLVVEGYPLSVVARDADDSAINRLVNQIREGCGYRVIPRQAAPRGVLEALRRNEVVAILMDQNTTQGGQFVPFFGRTAATVTGPAVIALRTGAALLPGFSIRQPDDRHIGRLSPPVTPVRTGDLAADVLSLTAHLTQLIEAQVRADPSQWLWIHDRWRYRPAEERAGTELAVTM